MWMSVPQIAVRFTRTFTSLGPACGSGTSSSHNPRAASRFTSAFTSGLLRRSKRVGIRCFIAYVSSGQSTSDKTVGAPLRMLSVLDLFRIGIGPSSSHTLGPMRIGKRFLEELAQRGGLEKTARIVTELQG